MNTFRLKEEIQAIQYNGLNFSKVEKFITSRYKNSTLVNHEGSIFILFDNTSGNQIVLEINNWITYQKDKFVSYTPKEFESIFVRV